MISKNIMQIHTFDDAIFYKTACDCCGDHEMTIEMEHDLNTIFLHLYSIVGHKNKKGKNKLKTFWNRIIDATRIIITGEIKSEEEFIMGSVDQINSFIKALEEGRDKLLLNMEKVKKMKKIKCVVCGSDMIINLESPSKSYGIDEDGSLYRVDNNDDKLYLEAVCSNDSEHDNLSNNDELVLWLEVSLAEISTILNWDSVIKDDGV